MLNIKEDYVLEPYGAREDIEDNEEVYYNLVVPSDKEYSPKGIAYSSTLLYPYALCFFEDDKFAFVYHVLLMFENVPQDFRTSENEIEMMDQFAVALNVTSAKAVIAKNVQKHLQDKVVKEGEEFYSSDITCLNCLNKFLGMYEKATLNKEYFRVVPLHLNMRCDEVQNLPNPLNPFVPMSRNATGVGVKVRDAKRADAIYHAAHEWNVELNDKINANIILDRFGPITMTYDYDEKHEQGYSQDEHSQHEHSHGEKHEHSHDLYTFVLREYDNALIGGEDKVYNIFWDDYDYLHAVDNEALGMDKSLLEDTLATQDELLYNVVGDEGIKNFAKIMTANDFLPSSMYKKFKEFSDRNCALVTGVYKVDVKDCIKIDFRKVQNGGYYGV